MSETLTNRRLRLRAPRGETDSVGLSLDRLTGSLADSEVDTTGVDGVELVFEAVDNPQAAVDLLEGLAEGHGGNVRVQELIVELHR